MKEKLTIKEKINKLLLILLISILSCLVPTIYFCTAVYTQKVIECEILQENVEILRDSIFEQSKTEIELRNIIKKIAKTPPIKTTKSYKNSLKNKQNG
jgi:hypothetical protein